MSLPFKMTLPALKAVLHILHEMSIIEQSKNKEERLPFFLIKQIFLSDIHKPFLLCFVFFDDFIN